VRRIQNIILRSATVVVCAFWFSLAIAAQSTDQNFPTAVTTNEIDGTIKARDIGDSRLTSFFYAFDGGQGDVFINVVTKNFSGDIDVFTVEGLRPLTKMVIYADGGGNETGRLVYMRKPERLILRVEGRSPNDDPATFRIKFAGSFIALAVQKPQESPAVKGTEVNAESGIRVNSVGTIVEVLPKPQPSPKATPDAKEKVAVVEKNKKPAPAKPKQPTKTPPAKEIAKVENKDSTPVNSAPKKTSGPEVKTVFKKSPKPKKTETAKKAPEKPTKSPESPMESQPDPMASIRLVVQFKDGKVIERPMSEVTKFSVDNGVLTVIAKDGSTVKYSILDVAKVTIE
jgi:hypothetical protein